MPDPRVGGSGAETGSRTSPETNASSVKPEAVVSPPTPTSPKAVEAVADSNAKPLPRDQAREKADQEARKNAVDLSTIKKAEDRSPVWRSLVSSASRYFNRPEKKDSQPLDREKNYSEKSDINGLIDNINTFQFEMNMRSERFRELSGQNLIGRVRGFVGGESRWVPVRNENGDVIRLEQKGGDFQHIQEKDENKQETGASIVKHSWQQETQRKTASVLLRTLRTAGLGLATASIVGFATGTFGVGAAFIPALIGSTAARGIFEGIRAGGSRERRLRGELEAVRIRYFQKTQELASRVGPEWREGMEGTEESYETKRNEAITSLVNFVYSYEELGVVMAYDNEGNPRLSTEVRGEPLEAGTEDKDPVQGGPAGPAFVRGVELYQPSDLAPDAVRVKDLENELATIKATWDKWEEIVTLAGGVAGSAVSLLQGGERWVADIFNGYRDQLAQGEGVKLSIEDNPLRGHVVQRVTDTTNHLKDTFVYHLRGLHEQFGAQDAGGHLMNLAKNADVGDAGRFGSHMLEAGKAGIDQFGNFSGELGRQINYAIWQKSVLEAIGYVGKTALMLGGSFLLGRHANKGNETNANRFRDKAYIDQEQMRRRLLPSTEELGGKTATADGAKTPEVTEETKQAAASQEQAGGAQTTENEATPEDENNPELIELQTGDISTAAERRRFGGEATKERLACFEVGNKEQMLISLRTSEDDSENEQMLGDIAEQLKDAYEALSQADRTDMKSCLEQISEEVIIPNQEYQDTSWSIAIITQSGQFYASRWNENESQLFTVDSNGRIDIPSRGKRAKGAKTNDGTPNEAFISGTMENGSLIALLDETLSITDIDTDNQEIIDTQMRARILKSQSSLAEKARRLIAAGAKGITGVSEAVELAAIISQYKKIESETGGDKEQAEREIKISETNPVSLKHKEGTNETFDDVEIKNDTVLSENFDGKRIYWQANLNNEKTEITMIPCDFDPAANSLKEYDSISKKSFLKLFDLREWILEKDMERAPEVDEALKSKDADTDPTEKI